MGRVQFQPLRGIDIEAQTVDVNDSQMWGITKGNQKAFRGSATAVADGDGFFPVEETIPSNEEWYANIVTWGAKTTGSVNCYLFNWTTSIYWFDALQNAGGHFGFPSSPRIGGAGDDIKLWVANHTGGAADLIGLLHIWYKNV